MTYIITDGELQMLISAANYTDNGLSYISVDSENRKKILGGNLEYRMSGLTKIGLFEVGPDGHYRITKAGRVIAKALTCPDCKIIFGRKHSSDSLFCGFKLSEIWIIASSVPDQKLNMLTAYFSNETLGKWLDEQFIKTAPVDVGADTNINTSLTYDEWYTWLMSQLVIMNRNGTPENIGDPFRPSEFFSKNIISYLSGSLESIGKTESAQSIKKLFVSPPSSRFINAVRGLTQKDIFKIEATEDRKAYISYTDKAVQWLDNDILTDSFFFCKKTCEKQHSVIFHLRRTGICTVYDTGKEIMLLSSKSIPWESYLI